MEIAGIIKRLKGMNKIKAAVFAGMIGILLIFLSDFVPEKSEAANAPMQTQNLDSYTKQLEKRLLDTVSEISGAGKIRVMITLSQGSESEYLYNTKTETEEKSDSDSKSSKTTTEKSYLTVDGKDGDQTVPKFVSQPEIKGVLVVCEGGGDVKVKTKVIEAVSKVFSISTAKICVTS